MGNSHRVSTARVTHTGDSVKSGESANSVRHTDRDKIRKVEYQQCVKCEYNMRNTSAFYSSSVFHIQQFTPINLCQISTYHRSWRADGTGRSDKPREFPESRGSHGAMGTKQHSHIH